MDELDLTADRNLNKFIQSNFVILIITNFFLKVAQYQLPSNVEIPISHDIPKTTLESLIQIKKEFELKIEEANQKNDSSKKRRYLRQSKV